MRPDREVPMKRRTDLARGRRPRRPDRRRHLPSPAAAAGRAPAPRPRHGRRPPASRRRPSATSPTVRSPTASTRPASPRPSRPARSPRAPSTASPPPSPLEIEFNTGQKDAVYSLDPGSPYSFRYDEGDDDRSLPRLPRPGRRRRPRSLGPDAGSRSSTGCSSWPP
ncbi:MAG: hypothetical protein MZV64_43980 [Ignavibacteriales bacterium]|nr:hypothetical protein [Ignavibacteriales bacterium]